MVQFQASLDHVAEYTDHQELRRLQLLFCPVDECHSFREYVRRYTTEFLVPQVCLPEIGRAHV